MSSLLRSVQIFPDLKGAHDPDLSYKKFDEVQHQTSIYVAAEDIPAGTEITDPRWVVKLDNSAAYAAEQAREEAEALRVAADAARMGFVPKGPYIPTNENKYGEWYTHEGGSYGYIWPEPSTGVPLSDTSHWQQIASKGDTGPSAYQAAVSAGYTGTEQEFNTAMSDLPNATEAANEAADLVNDKLTNFALMQRAEGNPVSIYPVPESKLDYTIKLQATQEVGGSIVPSVPSGGAVKLKATGKNLFNNDLKITIGIYADMSYAEVVPGKTYAFKSHNTSYTGAFSRRDFINGEWVPKPAITLHTGRAIVVDAGCTKIAFNGSELKQCELGAVSTDFEPYVENEIVITNITGQDWYGLPNAPVEVGNGEVINRTGYIVSYAGETVPDGWISSTGELSTGAQVVYPLAEPVITALATPPLNSLAQLVSYILRLNVLTTNGGQIDVWYAKTPQVMADELSAMQNAVNDLTNNSSNVQVVGRGYCVDWDSNVLNLYGGENTAYPLAILVKTGIRYDLQHADDGLPYVELDLNQNMDGSYLGYIFYDTTESVLSVGNISRFNSGAGGILIGWFHKLYKKVYIKGLDDLGQSSTILNTKVSQFSSMFNDSGEVESFMFATDPHVTVGANMSMYHNDTDRYFSSISDIYRAAPVSFLVNGGDWFNSNDTQEEACGKLGVIKSLSRKYFDRAYLVLGNHDTNYQGKDESGVANSGELTTDTIRNLWYRDTGNAYYSFDGANTKCYVLDCGLDWGADTMNQRRWDQVDWLAGKLLEDDAEHSAIFMHMYYSTAPTVAAFSANLGLLCAAYNGRTTVTLNSKTYEFTSCIGKMEFWMVGHSHTDYETTQNGIPVIGTINATVGGSVSFDLVLVDYDEREIKMVRVGTGSDRTVSLA